MAPRAGCRSCAGDLDRTWLSAGVVALAVQAVPPDSEIRDREGKPQLLAGRYPIFLVYGGKSGGKIVLHAYEIDPATRQYVLVGTFRDRLDPALPVPIDIDLAGIDRLSGRRMDSNEQDEFQRMRLVAQLERARMLVVQYEEHQAFYRRQVEDSRYELGGLDERLGGGQP